MQTFPYQITENVSRITPNKVVKSGWRLLLEREAEVTKFVRSNTAIPVPEVFEVRPSHEDPQNAEKCEIVMEFISGDSLLDAWPKMTDEQRIKVVLQLKNYIDEMRRLPQPHTGWIESCSGGPVMDIRVNGDRLFGPLTSESEFNEILLNKFKMLSPDNYSVWRSKLRDDHAIVFSHADLHDENILVDPETATVTGIIDWEMAGFWPEYWEYNKALYGAPPSTVWEECISKIMDCYEEEHINDSHIDQCRIDY